MAANSPMNLYKKEDKGAVGTKPVSRESRAAEARSLKIAVERRKRKGGICSAFSAFKMRIEKLGQEGRNHAGSEAVSKEGREELALVGIQGAGGPTVSTTVTS